MIKRVYKYKMGTVSYGPETVMLPHRAEILDISFQDDEIVVHCLVDPDCKLMIEHVFETYGTGWDIWYDDSVETYYQRKYMKTLYQGSLVWHVFLKLNYE